MSTSVVTMDKKLAADISGDVKSKLKSIRDKAVRTMSLAQEVYRDLASTLPKGAQGLKLGKEGLNELAEVLRGLSPEDGLAKDLRHVQKYALRSNQKGNIAIADLEKCLTQLTVCINKGEAGIGNLEGILHSLGTSVGDPVIATCPLPASKGASLSLAPSLSSSSSSSEKKTTAEDIKRKLEAIREKARRAMAIAADIGADVEKTMGKIIEGFTLGNEGLTELKNVLRTLDPASPLAQELRVVQAQALASNEQGSAVMSILTGCKARADITENIGNAAIASLESVIAHLPHRLTDRPSVVAFSASAMAARDATASTPASSSTVTLSTGASVSTTSGELAPAPASMLTSSSASASTTSSSSGCKIT